MGRENNFLLGHGERLTGPVSVPSGGGSKKEPYDFPTAKKRMAQQLSATRIALDSLPAEACPNDEAVALVTMHPRYVSKSDFPHELLAAVGLRSVGSRSKTISPERWGIDKPPANAPTEQIFVAGSRTSFADWEADMPRWALKTPGAKHLAHIEEISPYDPSGKLRSVPEVDEMTMLEVVLHNFGTIDIVAAFQDFAIHHGALPLSQHRRDVGGLTFLPIRATPAAAEELAKFSFVRVARGMPTLRPFRPGIMRGAKTFPVRLPSTASVAPDVRAVVFDGGLTETVQNALAPWVSYHEPHGIGPANTDFQDHGAAVTSALLFGPLEFGQEAQQPFCSVDHVRVLDERTGGNASLLYVDVLDRILGFLDDSDYDYQYANISLGPCMAVMDDEVTMWTACLDERFAHGKVLATVAAGNDGELDREIGLNRIQPPADGVNVLAIGAADRSGDVWERAAYSCSGPGRSPGVVKPDGIAFGGSDSEPFVVMDSSLNAQGTSGTSFAAPLALRSATGLRSQLGGHLGPLAIRALMIHQADPGDDTTTNVGWGRFELEPSLLSTCNDDEALVMFQGELPVGEHLRALVPLPDVALSGMVTLKATLLIGPDVDPEHPGSYTRGGLEVAFRPHAEKFRGASMHPKTKSFFSASTMYGASEYELRDDGQKWEPCRHGAHRFQSSSLKDPCFDIYYHYREVGERELAPKPIPYALVISVSAPKMPQFYNQVVRAFANVLIPLRPKLSIPIRT